MAVAPEAGQGRVRPGPEAFSLAVVVYRCPKWTATDPELHAHTRPAVEVVTVFDNFRVLTFAQNVECPTCWKDPGAFAPAFSHVVGIEWEPPES